MACGLRHCSWLVPAQRKTRGAGGLRGFRFLVVGAAGFELATLCSQSRCATRLRYAPTEAEHCNLPRQAPEPFASCSTISVQSISRPWPLMKAVRTGSPGCSSRTASR